MEQEDNKVKREDKKTESTNILIENQTEAPGELTETPAEVMTSEPTENSSEVMASEPTENSEQALDKSAELPTGKTTLSEPLAEASDGPKEDTPSNVCNKPESSEKKTPISLKAKSNIVKKPVAVNGSNINKNKGKAQARRKKKINNKKALQGNKESGGSDQGVKKQMPDKENKGDQAARNEEGINELETNQQKLEKGEKSDVENENKDEMIDNEAHMEKSHQVQNNKEKLSDAEKSQKKLKKRKWPGRSEKNQQKLEKGEKSGVEKENKDEMIGNEEQKSHQVHNGKEKISDAEKSQQKLKKRKRRSGSDRNLKNKEKDPEAGDLGANKSAPVVKKKEKVDGLIFMCSGKTKPDCFRYRVMGVSIGKKDTVMSIKRGMKLFLYDFELKLLYGIYKATAVGGVKLEPKAFNGAFPAQVRFEVHKDCIPLPENVFKKAIIDNYNDKKKFKTELSSAQVKKLMSLFRPAEIHSSVTTHPPLTAATDHKGEKESHSISARKGESGSSREKKRARDSSRNGDSRTGRTHSRERDNNHGHRESRREASPRGLYISEKEYRTYGLRGERRNLSPPRIPNLPPETYHRRDYERDPLARHSNVLLRDPIPLRRESGVVDPLHLSDRDYHDAYSLRDRRELLPLAPSAAAMDRYASDSYYSRYYGGSTVDSHLPPPRREDILSNSPYSVGGRRESYLLEADRRREVDRLDRLYSTYAPADSVPSHGRAYHSGRHDTTAYIPTSSQYSDAPSYYR